MAVTSKKHQKGIRLKSTTEAATLDGEIRNDGTNLKVNSEGSERDIVTADQSQELSNKTIDADNNTISNLEVDNLKAGVLNTDLSGAATDTEIPSALAVKNALAGQNEASEIDYIPDGTKTIQGTSTKVQSAIDDLDDESDDVRSLTGTSKNDRNLGTLSGNIVPDNTTIKAALQSLEGAIETNETASSSHIAASSGVHGVTGNVVGDSDTQTLQNKTLDSTNTFSGSVETPTRLDVKQDTESNLVTYASTASNGQLLFATDTKKMYQVIDSEIKPVGGSQIIELVAAEDITVGDAIYITTSGEAGLLDADDDDKIEFIGIAIETVTATNVVEVQLSGLIEGLSGLTAGEFVYADPVNPGKLVQPEPTQANVYIIKVGKAISATQMVINADLAASAEFNREIVVSNGTITNNQSSPTNISGLVFDGSLYRAVILRYSIYRVTDDNEVAQTGQLRLTYKTNAATWGLSEDYSGDDSGVTFTIDATGQIQYTSSDLTGANYNSKLQVSTVELFDI